MGQKVVVVLFHSALGLRPGVHWFADELRAAGYAVHTPDLYDGEVFRMTDIPDPNQHPSVQDPPPVKPPLEEPPPTQPPREDPPAEPPPSPGEPQPVVDDPPVPGQPPRVDT